MLYILFKDNRSTSTVESTESVIALPIPECIEKFYCFAGQMCILKKIDVEISIFNKINDISSFFLTTKASTVKRHDIEFSHRIYLNKGWGSER